MTALLDGLSGETRVLISLSVILFSGFLMTRLTKLLRLPNVSGYIIAGILIGPGVLGLVPAELISGMGFVSDIALAFIAFGVGKFFKKEVLRSTGGAVLEITLLEALAAGVAVTLVMRYAFSFDWRFSALLGAVATATAPASTMMTINQYRAKGEFVNILLQVVALDDVVCLLVFSGVAAAESASGALSASAVALPIIYNVCALALGFLCGWLLTKLLTPARSDDNRLIIVVAMLLGICGLCAAVNVSPLLACMMVGAVYRNVSGDKRLFKQMNRFTPPIMSLFFIVSGMNLDLHSLAAFGLAGVGYFIVRIAAKYGGAYLGCALTRKPKKIRDNLGFALVPQAGVAIGLAFLGRRMLPAEAGDLLVTVVLSSSVLYELIGPACAKIGLSRAGVLNAKQPKASLPDAVCEPDAALAEKSGFVLNAPAENEQIAAESEQITAENEQIHAGNAKIPAART